MRRYTRVAGVSDRRLLPRIGKIRLGVKVQGQKGEYPKEVDYFVIDEPAKDAAPQERESYDRFRKVYGKEPKALEIVIPDENADNVFPQAYKMYGKSTGLKCTGDGATANRVGSVYAETHGKKAPDGSVINPLEYYEIECPGEECPFYQQKNCRLIANFQVMIPKVSMAGVYQIDTSSIHSIIGINSALDYVRMVCGRISMLIDRANWEPLLLLKRVPKETHGSGKKEIHYPLTLELRADLERMRTLTTPARGVGMIAPPAPTEVEEDQFPKVVKTCDTRITPTEVEEEQSPATPQNQPKAAPEAPRPTPKTKQTGNGLPVALRQELFNLMKKLGWKSIDDARQVFTDLTGKQSTSDLMPDEAEMLKSTLEGAIKGELAIMKVAGKFIITPPGPKEEEMI